MKGKPSIMKHFHIIEISSSAAIYVIRTCFCGHSFWPLCPLCPDSENEYTRGIAKKHKTDAVDGQISNNAIINPSSLNPANQQLEEETFKPLPQIS